MRKKIMDPKKEINILILDDDNTILNSLKKEIESVGYNCIITSDHKEAISFIEKNNPVINIFIIDYFLKGLTGIEVLSKVREINRKVYTILLTGYADNMPGRTALANYDIDSYSEKSTDSKDILLKIDIGLKSISKNQPPSELSFEKRIRYLRETQNISRDELAQFLGVAPVTIRAYESGSIRPDFEKLKLIAKFYNVSFDYLLS